MTGRVNFSVLEGTQYIGAKNDVDITKYNAHLNTYFNIDIQQSAYFTMLIEGFEYNRFHASFQSLASGWEYGSRDSAFYGDPANRFSSTSDTAFGWNASQNNTRFDRFSQNNSIFWMPLKSLQYSQGPIETMSVAVGAFADLQLPFRKHSPTLSVETYDHRSDFFEMKLREWHAQSVITQGYVPVLESITKKVTIRSWATNGECNSTTICRCILADDITVNRSYEENGFKSVSFKLVVVGWGSESN